MNIYTIQYKNRETGKIYYIDDMYIIYIEAQEQTEQFADFDDFLSAVTDKNGLYAII